MHDKKIRLGILISGRGSNMQALVQACKDQDFPAKVSCVLTNNSCAAGLRFAENEKIPTIVVADKPLDICRIHAILVKYRVDLVCLAGFMRILKADFLEKWKNRVINIHPSLLPAFKGLNAQEQALKAGVNMTGCTVHYVTPEIDSGSTILQYSVPVFPDDDLHTLSERILFVEHKCYVEAIKLIAKVKLCN
ncbi:phosphoribosylglycinamide formyltransferase [Wolbachia pipientis]|uniref:Phosphoribosylglycinamide formyltransferase n=1 Tax=Wolbachia pipientis TaxID=955 RepID=A0A1E7QKJ6_WOLPI|nr:phosphoribosylglycinamide formyltransferase [Wolbachia pipientis]OEY87001.1 phosphoribosylglycinamide formyltransferase [Wolbachia pipientis]